MNFILVFRGIDGVKLFLTNYLNKALTEVLELHQHKFEHELITLFLKQLLAQFLELYLVK